LFAADAHGAGENWYLRTDKDYPSIPHTPGTPNTPDNPSPPATPATPATVTAVTLVMPVTPTTPVTPVRPNRPSAPVPTYRTEAPLLAALPEQLRQGNLAMLGNLHQRFGSDNPGESSTQDAPPNPERRAWGRAVGSELNIGQHGTVDQSSHGNLSGFQVGTDLYDNDHWQAGVYAGQLSGRLDVKGFARGIDNLSVGRNDLSSQYLGGYATWRDTSGVYVDTVLQGGRHRYQAHSDDEKVSGKAGSWLASVEVGKPFAVGGPWRLEPQLQLIHQNVSLDDKDIGTTRVRQDSQQQWLARLGTRLEGDFATDLGRVQPYARVNLYRSASGRDKTHFEHAQASTAISSS
ncbi:autotransporter outer membrane beta-barrel domain-containing protein, partial [Pseudomonas sp. ITA]|nr:autotransporter outer membrane beta-barrel domain-containing protein [Pseudomonas sp. ITA]